MDERQPYEQPQIIERIRLQSPSWFTIAWGEIGIHEIPGQRTNPRIQEYLRSCSNLSRYSWSKDETPWCSGFVNWSMKEAGYKGTDHALAKTWRRWGFHLELAEAPRGAVVVLQRRGQPIDGRGYHVTLKNVYEGSLLEGLGGNQSDRVQLSWYDLEEWKVRAVRWPWNPSDERIIAVSA